MCLYTVPLRHKNCGVAHTLHLSETSSHSGFCSVGVDGRRLIGHLRDRKFFDCSTRADSKCASQWLLPDGAKHDYETGKSVPLAQCKASCECTGNRGYYYSDLPYNRGKTTLQPYNLGANYGEVAPDACAYKRKHLCKCLVS